jgi:bifunctional pyridoxal-dependent enzyme with beta-cystathionase and maltose regulon repressor activities
MAHLPARRASRVRRRNGLHHRAARLEAGHRLGFRGFPDVMIGSFAACTQAPAWLDAAVAQIDQNRGLPGMLLKVQLPDVGYAPGSATFLAWLDCRGLGLGDDPAAAFLEHGKAALSPGRDFGDQGAGFARLNIGTSPELLTNPG